eukprot:2340636-Pleurochrysis_carterae.AAC.3
MRAGAQAVRRPLSKQEGAREICEAVHRLHQCKPRGGHIRCWNEYVINTSDGHAIEKGGLLINALKRARKRPEEFGVDKTAIICPRPYRPHRLSVQEPRAKFTGASIDKNMGSKVAPSVDLQNNTTLVSDNERRANVPVFQPYCAGLKFPVDGVS